MNVSFIGAPCSGKTTTASAVFSSLKRRDLPVEFVPEYARYYIARKRYHEDRIREMRRLDDRYKYFGSPPIPAHLDPGDTTVLNDADQIRIMHKQHEAQRYMAHAVGRYGVVISDTDAIAAMLYMSDEARLRHAESAKRIGSSTHLFFYSLPVDGYVQDANRIHDREQARQIHEAVPELLRSFAPNVTVITLTGSPDNRESDALYVIHQRLPPLYNERTSR